MAVVADARSSRPARPCKRSRPGITNVSYRHYAGVLQALGLLDGLSQIADIGNEPSRTSDGQRPNFPSTSISSEQPDRLAMADFEVHIDLDGRTAPHFGPGPGRNRCPRHGDYPIFEYDGAWLD